MDHHCPFFGTCIGLYNHLHFFCFCTSTVAGGAILIALSAYLLAAARPLSRPDANRLLFAAVFGTVVAVALGVLTAWHALLLARGVTTLEWLGGARWGRGERPRGAGRSRRLRRAAAGGGDGGGGGCGGDDGRQPSTEGLDRRVCPDGLWRAWLPGRLHRRRRPSASPPGSDGGGGVALLSVDADGGDPDQLD